MVSVRSRLAIMVAVLLAGSVRLDAAMSFRKQLTVDATRVSGASDHFGFPVLVSLQNDPDLQANVVSASGFDIQFRAADGVQILSHEIESYDSATGSLIAWVRIPRLRFDVDTVFYIYYGDAGVTCSLESPESVWDRLYSGVWHMAEDPSTAAPQITDSSFFGNHGTSGGAMTAGDQVPGKIAGSLDFDGIDDLVDAGAAAILNDLGPLTISAWIRPRTAGGSNTGKVVAKDTGPGLGRWYFEIDDSSPEVDAFQFSKRFSTGWTERASTNNAVSYGTWQYVTTTWDGSELGTNIRIFKNGTELAYQSFSSGTLPRSSDAAYPLSLGNTASGAYGFDGLLDEIRISRTVRSDGWVQTSFNNQDFPTKTIGCADNGFICVGAQAALPAPFTDVSAASGLNTAGTKDGGLAWGDFNNDGCLDVLVNSNDGAVGSRLYVQDNGGACDGTFTDVTACLAPSLSNVKERSAIWGDINNDGFLDFARNTATVDIEIYLNNGPGAACSGWSLFGAAGAPSQILDASSQPFGFNAEGLGFMDYDADGDLDLMSDQDGGISIFDNVAGTLTYVATPALPATQAGKSDYATVTDIDVDGDVDILDRRGASPDLFLNDANGGTFTAGTFDEAAANGDKGGIATCDFDDDGDFDLFWTAAGVNQVWEQTGVATFTARGVPAGILGVIDGVACGDVDNDGDLDLMLTSDGNDQLFRNDGAFTFTDISPAGFGANDGEGTAFGDYDRDGDVDILINQDTANELWRNETNNNGYLVVRALHDAGGVDRDAIGATIRLLDCGLSPVSGVREVNGGRGHGSQDPAYVHMGLPTCGSSTGPNSTYVVEVRFLDGAVVRKSVTPAAITGYQLLVVRNTDSDNLAACTTAVELVSFEAQPGDGAVVLEWETGSEVDNLGFNIYRSTTVARPFRPLNRTLIPGLGSSPSGAQYRFVDRDVSNGTSYIYELEDIETTGHAERHGPVEATPRAGLTSEAPHLPGADDDEVLPVRVVYGSPAGASLSVHRRGRHVELDLEVTGFYATPLADGSVRIEIPGFAEDDDIALPVRRAWVDALGSGASGDVEIVSVRARDVESFSLRPAEAAPMDVVADGTGTVRLERRRGALAFAGDGLSPTAAVRVVDVTTETTRPRALIELAPLRWDSRSQELLMTRRLSVRVRFTGDRIGATGGSATQHRRDDVHHEPRQVVANLGTRHRGLHALGFEDVAGLRRGVVANRLRLTRKGVSVPFHIEPNRELFGPGSTLFFLGEGDQANPFGPEAVYQIEIGVAGERMSVESGEARGECLVDYRHRIEREENRLYLSTLVDAVDPWLWETVFGGARARFPFVLSGVARPGSPAQLTVHLQGGTDFSASPDHHVRVWMNDSFVGEDSWNAKRPRELALTVSPELLRDGENVLEIENVGDTEAAYSMVFVDRWSLEYPRRVDAASGQFEGHFLANGCATLTQLGTRSYVVDSTGTLPRWIEASGNVFGVQPGHRYVVSGKDTLWRPRVTTPLTSRLRAESHDADYVVIGPSELVVAARALLTHRQSQGLNVLGVSLEEIDAEFGFGESDPAAVRAFISHAYHHWSVPPRYVVLLGDGSYDFKDYLGLGQSKLQVPPIMVKTQFLWTASDPSFAAVDGGDRLPDLAIGRLPAGTVSELETMVSKILDYESGNGEGDGTVVLVADDPDRAGDFEEDANALAATILHDQSIDKIYLRHLGVSGTRARILERFDTGASIVSYLGHGGINLWADEALFRSRDVDLLSPTPTQPIVVTMNCLNGYFHFPFFDSLSEALLKAEGKGAVAAFSPSGLSLHRPAQLLHEALVHELVHGGHVRLGDAVLEAQTRFAETGSRDELLSIYHLMGDPAMLLLRRNGN